MIWSCFDYGTGGNKTKSADKEPISVDKNTDLKLSVQQTKILQYIKENGTITSHQAVISLKSVHDFIEIKPIAENT